MDINVVNEDTKTIKKQTTFVQEQDSEEKNSQKTYQDGTTNGYDSTNICDDVVPPPSLLQKKYKRLSSHKRDELKQFRTSLNLWGMDQSTTLRVIWSWVVFIFLALIIPFVISMLVKCERCQTEGSYAFDKLVQIPETVLAAIAFYCLSRSVRRYGLRRFLFLDQLCDDMPSVQEGYMKELDRSFRLLSCILLPSFLVELVHKVMWLRSATLTIPYVNNAVVSNSIMLGVTLLSWCYRTGIFLLLCLLFRLTCHLQILRFEAYRNFLQEHGSDVFSALKEHVRIRHQLFLTSHRFRFFLLASLLTLSLSQLIALVLLLSSKTVVNFFNAGDLVVCSVVQMTGCLLCLVGAAKITHRAQGVVSVASRWHSLSTCSSHGAYYSSKAELQNSVSDDPNNINPFAKPHELSSDTDSDSSEVFYMIPSKQALASFQMRQCFVSYIEHNKGGITLFGFVLDRSLLHTIFAFEFSLVMWILSKSIA